MNWQEAIKALNAETQCVTKASGDECNRKCSDCNLAVPDKDILDAYRMAIKALSAMPEYEKLKERDRAMEPVPISGTTYSACPVCGETEYNNFCPDCGQRIDWTEQEEEDEN